MKHRTRFTSRPDGEWAECPSCARAGYGEDAWLPVNDEFWARIGGTLIMTKCKACRSEVAARKFGVVPANEAVMRRAA